MRDVEVKVEDRRRKREGDRGREDKTEKNCNNQHTQLTDLNKLAPQLGFKNITEMKKERRD